MEENKKNEEQKKRGRANFITNLIITLIAIVCVCLMFWYFTSAAKGDEISYDTFVSYVENGNVDTVELNASEINVTLKNNTNCWLNNRSAIEEDVVALVRANNEDASNAHIKLVSGSTTVFSIMNIIYPVLMVLFFVFLMWFIFRQFRGVRNTNMDFVRSRARISPSTTKFSDVAGADEEKEELREIIEFLKDSEKFSKIGARVPKGVLLVGPPGTGKTLLAKAVAGEANVPFFTISGSDFMELYVGVGASRVRDLFETAKKAKPCIIFIDEIDAVGRQRGTGLGGGNDEREQTLNQLLVQMDGFEKNENIIIMAATNRADILDPALLRPGRFDRQIYINLPDVKAREEILKVHARNKIFEKDIDLKQVARVTSGFTGADIENLLNEAAILAARENRDKIVQEDINQAIVKVSVGPQKKSMLISERDKKITAFHEAGHAVVEKFVKNNNPVHEVSIIPRGGAAGYTISRPDKDETHVSKGMLLDQICMLLAGRMSESLFLEDVTTGASNDLQRATALARHMVVDYGMSDSVGLMNLGSQSEVFIGRDYQTRVNYSEKEAAIIDEEVKKIIDMEQQEAKKILSKNANIVKNMVEVLLQKETIYSEEVDMIIQGKSVQEVVDYKRSIKGENKQERSVDDILKLAEERAKEKKASKLKTASEKARPTKRKTTKTTDIKQSKTTKTKKTKETKE